MYSGSRAYIIAVLAVAHPRSLHGLFQLDGEVLELWLDGPQQSDGVEGAVCCPSLLVILVASFPRPLQSCKTRALSSSTRFSLKSH